MREKVRRPAGYRALTALGAALLVLFAGPMLFGIRNLGTILGSLPAAVIILYSYGYMGINSKVGKMWKKTYGKALIAFFAVIVFVCASALIATVCLMASAVNTVPPEDATVIVLGCQVKGEEPSPMLERRLETAYAYLTEHPGAPCVVSGGKGNDENLSEAECMYRWLTARGIDGARIYVEDRSVNTGENLRYSAGIIRENGLPAGAAIVTDGFHQYRGQFFARTEGLEVGAVPAVTDWYLLPVFGLREAAAVFAQCVLS